MGAAGVPSGTKTYVDDVFSNYSFRPTGSSGLVINNGIDLATEGGMVWVKRWDGSQTNVVQDTERGTSVALTTNGSGGNSNTGGTRVSSFNSNGFTLGNDSDVNNSNQEYLSWTFRKAPGFFDVVTYTGNGSGSGQVINHNLGSVPGMIWVKRLNTNENWCVYHKSAGNNWYFKLDQQYAGWAQNKITGGSSTSFQVMDADAMINGSGDTYVAYVFGDDDTAASTYGTGGNEAIIKCGSFEGGGGTINVGFEPQWIYIKRIDGDTDGIMLSHMREIVGVNGVNNRVLKPSMSDGQFDEGNIYLTAEGFTISSASNFANDTHVYCAIRRPNKPVEDATRLYETISYSGNNSTVWRNTNIDWIDAYFTQRMTSGTPYALDRLRRLNSYISTSSNSTEGNQSSACLDAGNGFIKMSSSAPVTNDSGSTYALTLFRRAPGFFDVVTWTGNSSNRALPHHLDAVPELMIVKDRDLSDNWQVYFAPEGNTKFMMLNSTAKSETGLTRWNSTTPTADVFTVGTDSGVNQTNKSYFAWLFGSLSGVSKVGSYSGNTGYDVNVDCGFTAGARYILIKRADDNGHNWYVFNTTRGISTGNDPYTLINSSAAEVTGTDYIDPHNPGFTVTSSAPAGLNATGGTYVFLAIA